MTLPAPPTQQEIARLAYSYWEARGRVHGFHEQDWLQAERELLRIRGADFSLRTDFSRYTGR